MEGLTDVLCNYIYSSFQKLKKAIEKIEEACKSYIKKIMQVADGIKNVIRLTMSDIVKKMNQAIENIRKNIKPLLFDGPGKIPILCEDIWKCLALLQELLDTSSAFYKSLKKNMNDRCESQENRNVLDRASELITDFNKFRDIVCNTSFGIEFSIDAIKLSLKTFKITANGYKKLLRKKLKILDGSLDTYLHFAMDSGLVDLLNALIKFFNCAFGTNFPEVNGDIDIDLNPCAEISTAQNFFNEVLAVCHLVQCGDSYELDPEFRASVTSMIDGMIAICQDVIDNIEQLNNIMVNPVEIKVGFKGYENSKYIFPGQISGKNLKNTWNQTKDFINGIKTGSFTTKRVYKTYSTDKKSIVQAFIYKKMDNKSTYSSSQNSVSRLSDEDHSNIKVIAKLPTTTVPMDRNGTNRVAGERVSTITRTNESVNKSTFSIAKTREVSAANSANTMEYVSKGSGYKEVYQPTRMTANDYTITNLNKTFNTNKYSNAWILSHTFIDDDGNVFVRDGCDTIYLDNLPKLTNPIVYEFMTDANHEISDEATIMETKKDDLGNDVSEMINTTECAVKIACDPTSDLAIRCQQIWSTINNMYNEQNIVEKY